MKVKSCFCSAAILVMLSGTCGAAPQMKALIIDGQCNQYHDWKANTIVLKKILEDSGLFTVDVATSPPKGQDLSDFKPNFSTYNVLVLNYDGDPWPAETRTAFVDYVRSGGGVVVYHSADNAFTDFNFKPPYRLVRVPDAETDAQLLGLLVEKKDGKDLILRRALDDLRDADHQFVEVEGRVNPLADLHHQGQQLRDLQGPGGRQGRIRSSFCR